MLTVIYKNYQYGIFWTLITVLNMKRIKTLHINILICTKINEMFLICAIYNDIKITKQDAYSQHPELTIPFFFQTNPSWRVLQDVSSNVNYASNRQEKRRLEERGM